MMSPIAVRIFILISCGSMYCNAGENITAYVKKPLSSETCVSVPRIHSVCDIDWTVRYTDAENYAATIQVINTTISSSIIYRGLNPGDAIHCRRMYETMICRNEFPVCDLKELVIDHGKGKERCEMTNQACPSVSIEGCEFSAVGKKRMVEENFMCEPFAVNTTKLCPGTQLKVPKMYNVGAKKDVEDLTKIAEMFTEELKNKTNMVQCEMKYREVLCRLLDACSQDRLNYLHFISKKECARMISCVKSAGFSEKITSVCSRIAFMQEDLEIVSVKNPYIQAEPPSLSTTRTPTTSEETDPSTKKMSVSTEEKEDKEAKPTSPADKEMTTETLIEPSEESEKPGEVSSNNTIVTDKSQNNRGSAPGNYQNMSLFSMVLSLLVYHLAA